MMEMHRRELLVALAAAGVMAAKHPEWLGHEELRGPGTPPNL